MGRRQFSMKKVWEGVSSPGRRYGKASVLQEEGTGRRQFPMEKVWEGVSSPGRRYGNALVPQG